MAYQRIASFVIAVLLVLVLVQSASAVLIPDGGDISLYNAYGAQSKFNSVVALYGYDGSHWWLAGSGVVISDHCVIGAAHCAHYTNYGAVMGNKTSEWWAHYETTNVTVSPLYTGIGSTDLAIWTFSETITSDKVKPATLYTGDDSALVGTLGDFAGFGYYGYKSTGPSALDGVKRGCQQMITQLGGTEFNAGSDQFIMNWAVSGQYLSGMACDYDSGGGWFIDGASEPTLYAVHDWGTTSYAFNGATGVSQSIDWISAVSGVPEPSTLAMLGAAGIAFLAYWRRRA
jgi:hypothetical protein